MSEYNFTTDSNLLQLVDFHNEKVIDWDKKKLMSLELADSYLRLLKDNKLDCFWKYNMLKDCGSYLVFKRFQDNSKKLHDANFCRVRLCPMCAWRRSLKIFGQVSKVIDYLSLNHEVNYLFGTFTIKNCHIDDLSSTIDHLLYSWKKLTKQYRFKSVVSGTFRALEVTYNKNTDEWHPHLHVILSVEKSYFSNSYISQNLWSKMWQTALKVDYIPIVDIRKLTTLKGVAEASKYSVKGSDYLYDDEVLTDKLVMYLDSALAGRRLAAFSGGFRAAHKILNLDDMESGDLIHIDPEEINEKVDYILERYEWFAGFNNYYKVSEIEE